VLHPSGRKSHAVFSDGCGIPGVSGEEYVQRPDTPGAIHGGTAKLPGVVPWDVDEGLVPTSGSS
jgi:hypothetical protein